MTASSIPPLAVWPCGNPRLAAAHEKAQTVSGPPQSPIRSLEVSESQTDLLTLGHAGAKHPSSDRPRPRCQAGSGSTKKSTATPSSDFRGPQSRRSREFAPRKSVYSLHTGVDPMGAPRSSLSNIRLFSLEGKGRRTQDEKRVTCHSRGGNTGIEPHPAHVFPPTAELWLLVPPPLSG